MNDRVETIAALRRLLADGARGETFTVDVRPPAMAARRAVPDRAAAGDEAGGDAPALAAAGRADPGAAPSLAAESAGVGRRSPPAASGLIPFGPAAIDAAIGGGLERAGLHEIFPASPGDEGAATSFTAALAIRAAAAQDGRAGASPHGRTDGGTGGAADVRADAPVGVPFSRRAHGQASGRHTPSPAAGGPPGARPDASPDGAILWIDTRYSTLEDGEPWPPGLADLGLAADRLIRVTTGQAIKALQAAGEALACPALGAVVLELRGEPVALDLVATRRLSLAARAHRVPCFLLRTGAEPTPSPALTRWSVAARPLPRAAGPLDRRLLGPALYDIHLLRHRHGGHGTWSLQWCPDAKCFRQPVSQPALSNPLDRPDKPLGSNTFEQKANIG